MTYARGGYSPHSVRLEAARKLARSPGLTRYELGADWPPGTTIAVTHDALVVTLADGSTRTITRR